MIMRTRRFRCSGRNEHWPHKAPAAQHSYMLTVARAARCAVPCLRRAPARLPALQPPRRFSRELGCSLSTGRIFEMWAEPQLPDSFHVFDDVTSTMDKAKELISLKPTVDRLAVVARSQSSGRGTRGRAWVSPDNNLYLTVAFRLKDVSIPLSLVPLRVGSLVCSTIRGVVMIEESVVLKWPNDVLIGGDKVCGVLIEIENDFIIVGIGCNMFQAPVVKEVGVDAGRQATCVWNHCYHPSDPSSEEDHSALDDSKKQAVIRSLGVKLFAAVSCWLDSKGDSGDAVIKDFQRMMTMSPQRLRQANGMVHEGTEVVPIRINSDGSLEVENMDTNSPATLYTQYMW